MKTKIFTLIVCAFLLSLFANAAFAQEVQIDNERSVSGMIRGQQKVEQQGMVNLQKMDGKMDSCMTQCNSMLEQMQQMDAEGMTGGQMGMVAMMGNVKSLKSLNEQMKMMNQHMHNMVMNKEIMGNEVCVAKMKKIYAIMAQTNANLNQMTELSQQMLGALQKESAAK